MRRTRAVLICTMSAPCAANSFCTSGEAMISEISLCSRSTIGSGVPPVATTPIQFAASIARHAGLDHGRHVRQGRAPRQAADAEGFELTAADMADARSHRAEGDLVWPATTSISAGPAPRNGMCRMSTPASILNSSPARCRNVPTPDEAYCNSPGLCLGERDQLLDVVHRQARIDRDDVRRGDQHGNRREGFQRIVGQRVEPGIDRGRQRHDQERVAVLRRVGDDLGANHAAGAAAIVDDDLLAEPLAEMLRDDAGDDVVDAAGRKRHDQPHRPVRVILRRQPAAESTSNATATAANPVRMPVMSPSPAIQACAAGARISTLCHPRGLDAAPRGTAPARSW